MPLAEGSIGGQPVGAMQGGNLLGIPAGSLVFVDATGVFLFTTPGGVTLTAPESAPTAATGSSLVALDGGAYLTAQRPEGTGRARALMLPLRRFLGYIASRRLAASTSTHLTAASIRATRISKLTSPAMVAPWRLHPSRSSLVPYFPRQMSLCFQTLPRSSTRTSNETIRFTPRPIDCRALCGRTKQRPELSGWHIYGNDLQDRRGIVQHTIVG